MAFSIKIEPEARRDIQEGIDWYNEQQAGLGREFSTKFKKTLFLVDNKTVGREF